MSQRFRFFGVNNSDPACGCHANEVCAFRNIVIPRSEVAPTLAGMVVASSQSITELKC
jgi:hypothetical protein